ncbi:MAG: HEAT repeat domain-containing protein [Candidatus Aminicenantes bacterium]|nr:MAG: HEAT repeat domain-containing protein [Candidatus Aminicenantes bacterium]
MGDVKKISFSFVSVLIFVIAAFSASIFSQVVHHPDPNVDLNARWDWAKQEAGKQKKLLKNGFWIGYSIKRLMREDQYIYSTDKHTISGSHFTHLPKGDPLEAILSSKITTPLLSGEDQVKSETKGALDRLENPEKSGNKVWKDVAILYKFGSISSNVPVAIRASNQYIPFDPEGLPIFWLGQAEDAQSLTILDSLYTSSSLEKQKKRILTIAGLHGTSENAVAFLEKILQSREPDSLRARAASELGDQDHERAVRLLHQTAKDDRSFDVRKRSVYGLEDINLPSAADAMIDIAQNGKDGEIRKKAIDCLADIASKKTAAALKDVVENDKDTDIQKRAVYALEDLPDDEGIPYLVDIAKTHRKLTIRKAAIYCLGDSSDPRALQALIQIIKSKR